MAEFLTTAGTAHYIEKIIKTAKQKLCFISPYLQLSHNLIERLKDAERRGVGITIIFRYNKLADGIEEQLSQFKNLKLHSCKNLHAKCYLNEELLVITSMNLYEYSEKNNREMGVAFTKTHDAEIFRETLEEMRSVISHSEPYSLVKTPTNYQGKERFRVNLNLPINTKKTLKEICEYYFGVSMTNKSTLNTSLGLRDKTLLEFVSELNRIFNIEIPLESLKGVEYISQLAAAIDKLLPVLPKAHCIRCGEKKLSLDPNYPLCSSCYSKWALFENNNYREKFCHRCGNPEPTTIVKSLCQKCEDHVYAPVHQ